MLTKFKWTVYINGDLYDVMTDEEVDELMKVYKATKVDAIVGVIEF